MKTALYKYNKSGFHKQTIGEIPDAEKVSLVLGFGESSLITQQKTFDIIRQKFPTALIATCSTAGEIYQTEVNDDSISLTAIQFEKTQLKAETVNISDFENSYEAGKALISKIDSQDLVYVLILSDGSIVNGSDLVNGMNEVCSEKVLITGGLAGDGANFKTTYVGLNDIAKQGVISAIGFYSKNLVVKHGSDGGWETFGMEKTVTRSKGNIVYEFDHKNALELYTKYLGPEADHLPSSALLFPLSVTLPDNEEPVVRTILSINAEKGSMVFAGNIPEGAKVRFMHANFDRLTQAASGAASQTKVVSTTEPQLALLISCIGRKLILKSRIEEEIEIVDEMYQHKTLLAGFYSYGEISPSVKGGFCQLHNQTMTITTFSEL